MHQAVLQGHAPKYCGIKVGRFRTMYSKMAHAGPAVTIARIHAHLRLLHGKRMICVYEILARICTWRVLAVLEDANTYPYLFLLFFSASWLPRGV